MKNNNKSKIEELRPNQTRVLNGGFISPVTIASLAVKASIAIDNFKTTARSLF